MKHLSRGVEKERVCYTSNAGMREFIPASVALLLTPNVAHRRDGVAL